MIGLHAIKRVEGGVEIIVSWPLDGLRIDQIPPPVRQAIEHQIDALAGAVAAVVTMLDESPASR